MYIKIFLAVPPSALPPIPTPKTRHIVLIPDMISCSQLVCPGVVILVLDKKAYRHASRHTGFSQEMELLKF